MKKALFVLAIALAVALALPSVAMAYTWTHVGGDPLVPGGVWSTGTFSYKELNSTKVRKANKLVVAANGQPSWVLPAAYKKVAGGHVHVSYIKRGAKVGAMSYGRKVVRVVKNTTYRGQYAKLYYYYVNAQKTYKITKDGKPYLRTATYRVAMVKKCGNVWVKRMANKDVPLYPLYAEKRQDSHEGTRLAGWSIKGKVGTKVFTVATSATGRTLLGYFPAGTSYDLSEVMQTGWVVVSPTLGRHSGKTPNCSKTLTFVNAQECPPPPCTYRLYVEKRQDSLTGARLSGWNIAGTADGQNITVTTKSDGPTLVGTYAAGTQYDLHEILKEGWQIVTPAGGSFTGMMPNQDLLLTYVNKEVCPPPNHYIEVAGCWIPEICLDPQTVKGTLKAEVISHTDNDTLVYTWTVNGTSFTTTQAQVTYNLLYNTWYTITVSVRDAQGHTATANLPPVYQAGPGTPPPPS